MVRRLTDANRLSLRRPDVAAEWHPIKNGELTPDDVAYASNVKRWWVCKRGRDHEWDAAPSDRTSAAGKGCPFCAGRRVADSNRLSTNYPCLIPEWHPTKNEGLTPHDVTSGSNKKVWWRCNVSQDHEWEDSPNHRTSGRRCPFCAGKRVANSNRLSTNFPHLVPEWHSLRNGDLTPDVITVSSGRKVWWLCENGHEWDAVVSNRTRMKSGCPFCAGKRATDANRLCILYPDLAKEWHPTRNGKLTPDEVSYGSNKSRWWICDEGHEWETAVCYRTLDRTGCPYCAGKRVTDANRLSTRYPDVACEWHPTKNGKLTPADVHYSGNKKFWWLCAKDRDHEWDATPNHRTAGKGCPYCSSRRVADSNRLSTNHVELVPEWHLTKNGELTPGDVTARSNKKVWWRCQEGHEWDAAIVSRTLGGHGCPYCSGRRVSDANRLSIRDPDVAKEWHPAKNGDLTPDEVAVASNRKVWWQCKEGHEWEAVIPSRTLNKPNKQGCPYCAGQRVSDANRLSINYPDVAKEWHPTKNGDLTADDVSYGTDKRAWWLCKKGHEWDAVVVSRALKAGCPYCSGHRVTDVNRLSINYPNVAKEWHPTKNGGLTPGDVSHGSGRKVWWRCERRHEWEAVISSRSDGNGCRRCSPQHRSRVEIFLACELATFFDDIDPTDTYNIPTLEGRSMDVDVGIPSKKLVIEYDGAYWHRDKLHADIKKTHMLESAEWTVLRIREDPLEPVQPGDLQCPVTYPNAIKDLIDRVLIHLQEEFGIEIPGVDKYLKRKSLRNQAAADDIIGKELSSRLKLASTQRDPEWPALEKGWRES